MIRRLARGAGRAALGIAVLAALLVAVLHTPPGRNLLRSLVLAGLRRAGLEARLDRVEVAPLRLEASVFGLELGRPGHPPFLRVEQATMLFPGKALRGQLALRDLRAHGVRLELVRDERGEWNAPTSATSAGPGLSVDLRTLLRARIAATDIGLRVRDASGLEISATGLDLEWSGPERRGALRARDDVTWSAQARRGRLTLSPLTATADDRTLTLLGPRLAGPEGDASLTTRLGLDAATAPIEVDGEGRLHLGPLLGPQGPPVRGDLPWKARARGTREGLALELDFKSESLVVATMGMEAGGQVRAGPDRVTVEAGMQGSLPGGGHLSSALHGQWPWGSPLEIEAALDTKVEPGHPEGGDRSGWHGQAELRLSAGRYALIFDHRLGDAARLEGRAEGAADLARPLRSPLGGSLHVDVTDPAAIARLLADHATPAADPWLRGLKGRLLGDLNLGGTLGEPVALGTVRGVGLTSQGTPFLDAEARLRVDRRDVHVESLEARAGGGTLHAEAEIPLDGRPLTGNARSRLEDLGAWLPSSWAPSGQLAFQAALAGTLTRPVVTATVEGSAVSLLGQPTLQRVHARAQVSAEAMRLESLGLEQAAGRIEISGSLHPTARSFSLRAKADTFALEPLPAGAATAQALPLRARLDGTLEVAMKEGSLEGGGRFELRDSSWDGRSLGAATFEVSADGNRPHGFTAELSMDGADLRAFARAAGAEDSRIAGTASLKARLHGGSAWELDLTRLEGAVFDLPLRLRGPAHLSADEGRASILGLDLDLAGGRLAAGGTLDSSGQGELQAEWRGALDGLSPLLAATASEGDAAPRLAGEGDLVVVVRGTPKAPRPEATLRVEGGGVSRGEEVLVRSLGLAASFRDGGRAATAGGLLEGEPLRVEADLETDAPFLDRVRAKAEVTGLAFEVQSAPLRPDGSVTLELAHGLLTVPPVHWRGGDNDLRVGGTVRLPTGGGPWSAAPLDIEASGTIDLRLLAALGRGIEAGGTARVEAHVQGTPAAPSLDGSLRLEAAVFRYRPWRISVDDVTVRMRAAPDRLVLETLTGTLNGGTMEGKGELRLSGTKPHGGQIDLAVAGAALDWPKGFRGSLDAGLELRGGTQGLVMGGTLALSNAAYKGDPRTLVPDAKPALSAAGGETSSLLGGLGLDLRLRAEHEVRVDTPFGAFPFSVDLRARGTAAEPRLQGEVSLGRGGFIYWSGRRFALERGALTWSASGGLVPFVETRATTRVSSYTVTAQFSGPLTSADAGLSSNPPLSESEIASLLTTGSTTAGTKDSRALGIVSANFLGSLGQVAGLDSVRIESADESSLVSFDPTRVASEANPAQRLTISKRLSHNLEATVSLNLAESGKTTTFVSWKPRPPVEVRVAQRDDYTGSLELRHDVSFGGGGREPTSRAKTEAGRRGRHETVRTMEIEDGGGGGAPGLARKLKLQPGKTFRYDDWQDDRERIEAAMAREGYAEAYVIARREPRASPPEGGEVALTYLVRRGPRTVVEFRGLPAPESLRSEIASAWASGDFDTSIEEEAKARVRAHFARRGFFTAHVSAEVETSGDGKARTLVIAGEPGPPARGRRVAFVGAALVPGPRLEALVKGRALEDQAWSDPKRLETAVVVLYRQEGFLTASAKARPAIVERDEAVLTVEIEEGPLFHFGSLDLRGCASLPCAEAGIALGLHEGTPYREGDVGAARGRLLSFYRKRGFNGLQVRLDGEIRTETARVDLHAKIEENAQQVVREVMVAGADPATERTLDRVVKLTPGQPVVLEDWAAIRKRVYETGLVRGMTLEPEVLPRETEPDGVAAPDAVEPVRARVEYDMWPALRLRYGLQLVTQKPLSAGSITAVDLGATAELTRAIFLGRAVSTALSGEVRSDIWNARGVLSAPRTFGHAVRSSLFVVREHEKTEIDVGSLATTIGAISDKWEATFEERWRRRKLELALSYDVQWLTVGSPSQEFADVRFRPARLIGTVLLDGRSSILDPRKGYFSSVTLDQGVKALGSEFDVSRIFTQQFAYVPLPGSLVAASGLRFDRASGSGQNFLTTERLSFGGPTTVRGYDRPGVDLLDLLGAVGATTDVLVLNQELRFPILGDLRGVAFVDYGKVSADLEGIGANTRLGTGIGLRYSTPVGVLRIDLGFPLRGPEKTGRVYFGLGQAY